MLTNEEYNGDTGKRLIERAHDVYRVLKTGNRQKKFRRKLSEVLFIKQNKPALNKQEASVLLKLFN